MKKKFDEVLCQSCVNHYKISGCDVCGRCNPNWSVKNDQFICHDYVKKKEIENDEKA